MSLMYTLMILPAFAGFTLLQLGCSQPKNTSSIIINNVLSLAISTVMFWVTGYAFAFGASANAFVAHSRFFLIDATTTELNSWFHQFSLLMLFIVIVNGGFAERMRFWVYPLLTLLLSGFFYPVSTHWAWHKVGWLKKGITNSTGQSSIFYEDVGGAGVIHVSAGAAALVAAVLLGARVNRKQGKDMSSVGGETNTNIFLGAFLVLTGLASKNIAPYTDATKMTLSAINCMLATFASAVFAFLLKRTGLCGTNWNTKTLLNSAIMGMVAVSGNPGDYHPYGGFAIGVVSGCVFVIWNVAVEACGLDDISDTITVHLGGGIFGVLASTMFSKTDGVFYHGEIVNYEKFGWNLLGALVFFAWHAAAVLIITIVFFCFGKLSYDPRKEVHVIGLDVHEHDEPAYPNKETFPDPEMPFDLPVLTDMRVGKIAHKEFYGGNGKAFENISYGEARK